jgi:hypothetical protein
METCQDCGREIRFDLGETAYSAYGFVDTDDFICEECHDKKCARIWSWAYHPVESEQVKATKAAVLVSCQERLDHLGIVTVATLGEIDPVLFGVGLTLHDRTGSGWRHGVSTEIERAMKDPAAVADAVVERMLAWHRDRRPEDESADERLW